jgi:DNA polymerase mu
MATRHASSRSPSPFSKSTYSSPQRPSKRTKGAPGILTSHRVFILQPKLSQTDISEIFDLAESADADIVSSPDEADIVITKIGMRKRLERHIEWNLAVSVEPALVWDRILQYFDPVVTMATHQHRNESVL